MSNRQNNADHIAVLSAKKRTRLARGVPRPRSGKHWQEKVASSGDAVTPSRRAILIDLNPDYLKQQLARNAQTPLGLDVA